MNTVFNEFAIILSLSVLVGFVAIKLRQPLILSFIVVGIIAGPSFLGWITNQNEIEILASFGIMILLFIVGLKLDIHLIKNFGVVTLIVGIGQMFLTFVISTALSLLMHIPMQTAIFTAIALTFSSTIIIIKVLSDRFEIDTLHGRIAVGVLIIQDLVVVIAIIVLSSLSIQLNNYSDILVEISSLILKGIGFIAILDLVMRYILPILLSHLAKSRELLVLFSLSWCVTLAMVSEMLGFGKEVGGFVAGVTLASTHYRDAIASRLHTVRNILLLFFFLNLGASLRFNTLGNEIIPAIVLSIFVLIGKPLIVMALMGLLHFRKRTSFLTGMTMGQISEFSLILAALGTSLGYVDKDTQGLITFVGLFSIGLSTYMMAYANQLYDFFSPWLNFFERRANLRPEFIERFRKIDVIVYGFGRHGEYIASILDNNGISVLAIDFDPRRVKSWDNPNIMIVYGDAENIELPRSLPLDTVQWVISTIPFLDTNKILVSALREVDYKGKIALSAHHEKDIHAIKNLHVDMIFVPFKDAAQAAARRILDKIHLKN